MHDAETCKRALYLRRQRQYFGEIEMSALRYETCTKEGGTGANGHHEIQPSMFGNVLYLPSSHRKPKKTTIMSSNYFFYCVL